MTRKILATRSYPDDLDEIVVRGPATGERVALPCRDPDGATLWERRNTLKWMRLNDYDLADRENWLIAKKEIRDSMMARLLNTRGKISSRTRAAREARIGEEARTNPTVLHELYGDDADQEWLRQEFAKSERAFPADDDEPVVTGGGIASSETQSGAGMSQFGRRTRRPKTKSRSKSRQQAAASAQSAPTGSEQDIRISDEEAAEEHREQMAAFKRPNLNTRVS